MLKTWRDLVASEEILPRLCDALQKIRRHDLAVKMGLELGVYGELLRRKKYLFRISGSDVDTKHWTLLDLRFHL